MEEIKTQVSNLQVSLTEVQLALEYQSEISLEAELMLKYKSLLFITRIIIEYVIPKTAILIDKKEKLNILKPFNKILSDKKLQKEISDATLKEITKIKNRIENMISDSFKEQIDYIRDKYIAHNDFGNRESINIDLKAISNMADELAKELNSFCEFLGLSTMSVKPLKVNSISDLIDKLKT